MNLPYSRFNSETEYRQALETVIGLARSSIRILDYDLRRMQLETARGSQLIKTFLEQDAARQTHIAVHNADFLQRHAPRILRLLETRAHAIEIRQLPESLHHMADCHLLADRSHGVRRFHKDLPRGAMLTDNAAEITPWWLRFDEIYSVCQPIDLAAISSL